MEIGSSSSHLYNIRMVTNPLGIVASRRPLRDHPVIGVATIGDINEKKHVQHQEELKHLRKIEERKKTERLLEEQQQEYAKEEQKITDGIISARYKNMKLLNVL